MPRFYETTLSITNLHNLSISTHVNRSRIIFYPYRQRLSFHTNVLNLLCNSLNRSIISSKEGALA